VLKIEEEEEEEEEILTIVQNLVLPSQLVSFYQHRRGSLHFFYIY
jgi:hypothetical protein